VTSDRAHGWVYEVFTSIQGEGLYCGQRQTFVRLAGCNLSCDYCDTPAARNSRPGTCRMQRSPGGEFDEVANPVESEAIVAACRRLGAEAVSLTGGEPLVQEEFAAALLSDLSRSGFANHLETNGTLPNALNRVMADVDVVAMDIKVPSAGGDSVDPEIHRAFLRIASQMQVFVKAVVGPATTPEEVRKWAELITEVDRFIPLVIQPVAGRDPVAPNHLLALQEAGLSRLEDVRVIPQCHKILGLM